MPGWPKCPKWAKSLRTCASVNPSLRPNWLLLVVSLPSLMRCWSSRRYRLSRFTTAGGTDAGSGRVELGLEVLIACKKSGANRDRLGRQFGPPLYQQFYSSSKTNKVGTSCPITLRDNELRLIQLPSGATIRGNLLQVVFRPHLSYLRRPDSRFNSCDRCSNAKRHGVCRSGKE